MISLSRTLFVVFVAFIVACGSNNTGVKPSDRLCGGDAALAFDIASTGGMRVELCANAKKVSTVLTASNTYDIRTTQRIANTSYEVHLEIPNRKDAPVVLGVTADPAEAAADLMLAFIFVQEFPASGDTLVSSAVTSGSITLGYSDGSIATGTLSGWRIDLANARTGARAGSLSIDAGFFSVQVSP